MKQPHTMTGLFLFEGRKGQRHTAFPFGVRKEEQFYPIGTFLFLQPEQSPGNDEEGFTGLRGDKLVGEAESIVIITSEPGGFDAAKPGFAGNDHPAAAGRADYGKQRFRFVAYRLLKDKQIFGIRQAE